MKIRVEEQGLQWYKSGHTYLSTIPLRYAINKGLRHWTLTELKKPNEPITWGSVLHCMRVAEIHHLLGKGTD